MPRNGISNLKVRQTRYDMLIPSNLSNKCYQYASHQKAVSIPCKLAYIKYYQS